MSISVSGLISGTDYDSLITQLMTVESLPLTALAKKEASYQSKITAFGTLKSSLAEFQTSMASLASASTYKTVNASIADSTIASVSATTSATAGTYSLQVTQLAQAQKLVAAGQASSTSEIGSGVITFDFGTISDGTLDEDTGQYTGATFTSSGSGIKTVTIDSSNNTLSGIRDAINNAGIGVTATIVNDGGDTPYRLSLSVGNSGEANSLKISVDTTGALSTLMSHDPAGTQGFTQTSEALNAEFTVDGIAISKASNTVTDVLTGLTLNLLKTNSGSTSNITVSRDTTSITEAVNSFVAAYNTISSTLTDALAYNATTKTASILNGEASVRTIQTQLRSILSTPLAGGGNALSMLSQIGVAIKDGEMTVNSTTLNKALASNFDDFAGLFAANGTTTDSLISYASSTSQTLPGSYAVNITKLATQGSSVASAAAGLTIEKGINDTLVVQLDGISTSITLSEGTYKNAAALAAEIQSQINGATDFISAGSSAKVTASSGGVLTITSNRYGSASNAMLVGGNGQDNLNLGSSASVTAGEDVAGTIDGITATGSGQTLTAAAGGGAGISLTINGGSLGDRGTVNFSQGYAYKLNELVTSMLGEDGSIAARIDGIKDSIADVTEQEERINDRLTIIEARYRAQFTALELLISSMNTTSSFLTQQLEALADLRSQSN